MALKNPRMVAPMLTTISPSKGQIPFVVQLSIQMTFLLKEVGEQFGQYREVLYELFIKIS
jgi:hypothetical protein